VGGAYTQVQGEDEKSRRDLKRQGFVPWGEGSMGTISKERRNRQTDYKGEKEKNTTTIGKKARKGGQGSLKKEST